LNVRHSRRLQDRRVGTSGVEWTIGEYYCALMNIGMVAFCRRLAASSTTAMAQADMCRGCIPLGSWRGRCVLTVVIVVVGLIIGTVAVLGLFGILPRPQ
jgi:hypothetical protein